MSEGLPVSRPHREELPRIRADEIDRNRPAHKAKPNTRFLGRIIKETTNHNAALLARESAEARARLDDLTEAEEKKRLKTRPTSSDIRRRQLVDISSILSGGKRKRKAEDKSGSREQENRGDRNPRKDRDDKRDGVRHEDNDFNMYSRPHRRVREDREDEREFRKHRQRSRSPPDHASVQSKYRQRSPLSDEAEHSHKSHTKTKPRTESSRNGRGLLSDELSKRRRHGRLTQDHSDDESSRSNRRTIHWELSDKDREEESEGSDPLDELIGPAPPKQSSSPIVRPRGRGFAGGKSLMDSRWSNSYDPRSDSNGDGDHLDDDWDNELEAFRDRQKWKQQGAERLRTAGFTEEQIKKWEGQKPGAEKDFENVKWSKQGEKREWDRGKVLADDG